MINLGEKFGVSLNAEQLVNLAGVAEYDISDAGFSDQMMLGFIFMNGLIIYSNPVPKVEIASFRSDATGFIGSTMAKVVTNVPT